MLHAISDDVNFLKASCPLSSEHGCVYRNGYSIGGGVQLIPNKDTQLGALLMAKKFKDEYMLYLGPVHTETKMKTNLSRFQKSLPSTRKRLKKRVRPCYDRLVGHNGKRERDVQGFPKTTAHLLWQHQKQGWARGKDPGESLPTGVLERVAKAP